MAKEKHIHKLKRLKYKSGNTIFFCALPDCTYKTNVYLALGKRSLCWRCGEPFVMDEYNLRLAKPHCNNCHKPKKSEDKEEAPMRKINAGLSDTPSLAERLNQTIQSAKQIEDEEI